MKKLTLFLALILSVSALAQREYVANKDGSYVEEKEQIPKKTWDLPERLKVDDNVTDIDVAIFTEAKHDTIYLVDSISYIGYDSWAIAEVDGALHRSLTYDGKILKVEEIKSGTKKTYKIWTLTTFLIVLISVVVAFFPKSWLEKVGGDFKAVMLHARSPAITVFLSVSILPAIVGLVAGFETAIYFFYSMLFASSYFSVLFLELEGENMFGWMCLTFFVGVFLGGFVVVASGAIIIGLYVASHITFMMLAIYQPANYFQDIKQ